MGSVRSVTVSLAAAFWGAVVLFATRVVGLARTLRLLAAAPRLPWDAARPLPARVVAEAAARVLEAKVFGKLVFRTRCLKRALVLYRLLRVHGHPVSFHLGVHPKRPPSESHAWVTLGGEEIPEAPALGNVAVYTCS